MASDKYKIVIIGESNNLNSYKYINRYRWKNLNTPSI